MEAKPTSSQTLTVESVTSFRHFPPALHVASNAWPLESVKHNLILY